MSSSKARQVLAERERAGRVVACRLGARTAESAGRSGALAPPSREEFATLALEPASGGHAVARARVGDAEIVCEVERLGEFAVVSSRVRNVGAAPLQLEGIVLGLAWEAHGLASLRFLRHGWQSWSFTGSRALDAEGERDFPSGEWLRGMHHACGARRAERAGWHESDTVTAVGASPAGPSCVVGALESGRAFAVVHLRGEAAPRGETRVAIEVEQLLEVCLDPGEVRELERVYVAVGFAPEPSLERYAQRWGRDCTARTAAPFAAGWCSWYHFFHEVSEADVLRNLEALSRERDTIPIDVVQIDDGYQRAVGDWLETNARFPRGIAPLAKEISDAGFRPGIWTAPFCVVPQSRIFQAHPEWLLRDGEDFFLGLLHGEWSPAHGGRVHALDPTHEEVRVHLRTLFASFAEMGFDYLKLDFLHAVAMRADARDARATRAERLRLGLDAIRDGAGDDAFLLGCGCPLGPAVGIVDAMRIGPDVAPYWAVDPRSAIPGIEPALPSLHGALRSVIHRSWMHRRLWSNDPDCLMARASKTELSRDEARTLAAAIAATGGSVVFSDDLEQLDPEGRELLGDTLALARAVDGAHRPPGVARVSGLLDDAAAAKQLWHIDADLGLDALRADLLLGEASQALGPLRGEPRLGTRRAGSLQAHASRIAIEPGAHTLAVFCDFDGTFSVQDVGSTLAQIHLQEKRPGLWQRYEDGEITAWEYNEEIFTGFALPETELEAFLRTIDLDPGARGLLDWCHEREIPFRILSDGFDHNLDALQRIHSLDFEYTANSLRYADEGGSGEAGWRIGAGAPDPECSCGTGVCKRAVIRAYRRVHPSARCVHVGNGRVSDLCGTLEADLAFAKDSLAEALAQRGGHFVPFEDLGDVRRWLAERLYGSSD